MSAAGNEPAMAGRSALRILPSEAAKDAAEAVGAIFRGASATPLSKDFFARDFRPVWRDIAAGGWLTLGLPEAAGGPGFHLVDLALVAEAWGRHLIPLPFMPTVLARRWAGRSMDATETPALTYSLPDKGGHTARAIGPFVGSPGTHHVVRLSPLTLEEIGRSPWHGENGPGGKGASSEGDGESWCPSLRVGTAAASTLGLPQSATVEITVLGIAELLGSGSVILEQTLAYAKTRVQFDRPIAEYQAVQHLLADMHRDLEMARTALVYAANEPERAAGAAGLAWDRIRRMAERCIQIHGGFGFTWDAGLHYYVRHVWAWGRLLRACGAPAL